VPAVGFISRLCRGKGLDTLLEAVLMLKRDGRLAELKLRLAGGKTAGDEPLLAEVECRLAAAGREGDIEYINSFDRQSRIRLLHTLSVLSVPTRQGEAFGMYVVEAMACGVPVVLPRHGAFTEIVEATGGGLLCQPNDPQALAEALAEVLLNADKAREMSSRGREAAARLFDIKRICRDFLTVCEEVIHPRAPDGQNTGEA
jgi:glycosyltransferase involved in cell wall biosynthesis